MNWKLIDLEFAATIRALYPIRACHLPKVGFHDLICRQHNVIFLHELPRRLFFPVWSMIRADTQTTICKLQNLFLPLRQCNHRTDDKCARPCTSISRTQLFAHLEYIHFVRPICCGFLPQLFLVLSRFHVPIWWMFHARFAVLKHRTMIQNCGYGLNCLAKTHFVCKDASLYFMRFHFLVPHPTKAFNLERQQVSSKTWWFITYFTLERLLNELIR
mmetsp:Transcript_14405/g.29445  ORF Transcript_14405/g.29445 Transcript_14405/m.29445 type:complete len:216 (-) Transcript_14405:1162-1809(-)